ncbi:CHASE domain-containing protein [Salinivibrio kushneri]|uniref:CHASE domain-containing protein n=1 Tax=Salinivibrio kushneri TaxID=1908198 RepID=UPI000986CD5F|nr:diguanylate cyclase [Salinivibrio kushneri]OOE62053.1 hypothetical protein BZG18_05925 [Salinivibrio kushneri]
MPRRAWSVIVLTALIGVGFAALTAHLLYQKEQEAIRKELHKDVNNAAMALAREVNLGLELLYAVKNHFDAGHRLDARNFQPLTSGVLTRHPSFKSIEWVDIVMHHQRRHYVQGMEERGATSSQFNIVELDENNQLIPAQRRDMYFPLRFTSGENNEAAVIGFDLGSTPVTRQALKTSFNTGVPVATPATTIERAYGNVRGFLLIMPILLDPEQLGGEDTRDLRGFLVAVIDVNTLVNLAIDTVINDGINYTLIDSTDPNHRQVLHTQRVELAQMKDSLAQQPANPIFFAGREWELIGYPTVRYMQARQSWVPLWTFLIGSGIFLLICYLLYRLQSRAYSVQVQVDQKTHALKEANSRLESMTKCDGLTGLYNRTQFEQELEREIQRALRDDTSLSLMVVEVQHLSNYNKQYGRMAGDQLIRQIAQVLDEMLKRPGDLVCRFTGSQFVAILPRTEGAERLAEECVAAVNRLQVAFEGEPEARVRVFVGGVTVSDQKEMTASRLHAYGEIGLTRAKADNDTGWHWMEISASIQDNKSIDP